MILAATVYTYVGFMAHYRALACPRPLNWWPVCPVHYETGRANKRRMR